MTEAKTGERTALVEALKDTLRMLEAAYWQLGMNVRNNPRIVKARSALEAARKTEGQKT